MVPPANPEVVEEIQGKKPPQHGEEYVEELEEVEQIGHPATVVKPLAAAVLAPAAALVAAPIVVNGRSFRDARELAEYTALVESRVLNPITSQDPKRMLIDGKPLEDVMFNDPLRYHEWTREQLKTELKADGEMIATQKNNESRYWENFYSQHPDLIEQKWVVQSKFREEWPTLEKMSVEQSMLKLANDSRGIVDSIKQKAGIKTTELQSGAATTLGASVNSVPRVKPSEKVLTFVEQFQAKARKRRA